jgi:hypothetical protein
MLIFTFLAVILPFVTADQGPDPAKDKYLWTCLLFPMGTCRSCLYWGKYFRKACGATTSSAEESNIFIA